MTVENDISKNKNVCELCGSTKTWKHGNKEDWYGKRQNKIICGRCWEKLKNKEKQEKYSKVQCACGCGELISSINTRNKPAKYKQWHNSKITSTKGSNHQSWKGGKITNKQGYIMIHKPDHHFANISGYVMEHRLIYEEYYNCCLLSWIDIHHINHNRKDNRIENLITITRNDHMRLHIKKDMSNRFCLICNSKETTNFWHRHPITKDEWYCYKCYRKLKYQLFKI